MNKLTIFLGDIDYHLSTVAKGHDASAWLLNHNNYKTITETKLKNSTTVYTSLGDLPPNLEIVYDILSRADVIFYCPPKQWSDQKLVDIVDPGSSIQGLTEILLALLPSSVQINNFVATYKDPNPVVDTRKTKSKQMWVAGCSISHGIGVKTDEKYGSLIAKQLNLSCSFLTRPGTAMDWAADQILRSDIKKNDLVIWGLTNPERLTYIHDNQLLEGVTIMTYDDHPEYKKIVSPENLYSQQNIYKHFYALHQVINFCNKAGAKLFLVGILNGLNCFLPFLKSQKNYIHVPYTLEFNKSQIKTSFIDLGTDLEHPGPKQHIQYKQLILNKINQST